MYERLDKLREEVKRCEKRLEDSQERLKNAQAKLKEAEATQILSDVGALNLTPEQLAQFLQLAASGQLQTAGSGYGQNVNSVNRRGYGTIQEKEDTDSGKETEENEDDREDDEDENN